jgi:DNA repair exonuclease SbcCD ATPase subunit
VATNQSAPKSAYAEPKCPVCKSDLAGRSEYEATIKELEKRISESSSKQRKEFQRSIQEMKVDHRHEMRTLRKNMKSQQLLLRKRSSEQSKKERDSFRKKMNEMKKNHQVAQQYIRETYEKQNLMTQKEQEKAVNNQMKDIMQNYSSLASSYQKEIEKVRKMQEQNESTLRRKESEVTRLKMQLTKSNTDLQIRRLVVQLGERNASIEQLQRRIRELESMMAPPQEQRAHTYDDSTFDEREQAAKAMANHNDDTGMSNEQRNLRDEFMTAIKEITREHQRAHEDNINNKNQSTPASVSGNAGSGNLEGKDMTSDNPSKTGKMRSWFF